MCVGRWVRGCVGAWVQACVHTCEIGSLLYKKFQPTTRDTQTIGYQNQTNLLVSANPTNTLANK